jgi:SAM-dependent methyltransferase
MKELYIGDGYASCNPSWHVEDAAWKAEQVTKILARNNCHPRRIVDVGCGVGGVLSAVLESFGPEAEGIGFDISPYATSIAKNKERKNLQFQCMDISDHPNYSGYDLLLCIDVFEHVENYIGFLKNIRTRSEYFVFHVPLDMNIKGLLRKYHMKERQTVGHIHYFDYMSAISTLNDTGYEILDRFYTVMPAESLLTKIISISRRLLASVTTEDFAIQLLGGASLLILARQQFKC